MKTSGHSNGGQQAASPRAASCTSLSVYWPAGIYGYVPVCPPQNFPIFGDSGPRPIIIVVSPALPFNIPNDTLIGSAVLHGALLRQTDTDRHDQRETDHATMSAAVDRIPCCLTCVIMATPYTPTLSKETP